MTTHAKHVLPHMKGRSRKTAPCDVHTTLRIPHHLDAELRCLSASFRTSKADLIRRCIAHGIKTIKEKTNGTGTKP